MKIFISGKFHFVWGLGDYQRFFTTMRVGLDCGAKRCSLGISEKYVQSIALRNL